MTRAITRPLTRLAFALAVAATGAALPLVASASGDDTTSDIVVESAGDQTNAITLPAPAAVGQTADTTMILDMSMALEAGGPSTDVTFTVQMAMTAEVVEVGADGGYVAHTTINDVEVTDAPAGVDTSTFPCAGVTGAQMEQTFDAAGNSLSIEPIGDSADPSAAACVDQISSTQSQSTVVFPAEPVGPGATWTAELVGENQGIEIPVTYHYSLTDVSDGRYTLEATLASQFEVSESGMTVAGTMTGAGTVRGAVDNPLAVSSSFDVSMDMADDTGEFAMSMDIGIDVEGVTPQS